MHSPVPVAVAGLSGVAALAAGGSHTCARKTDGTVVCWGLNDCGQLGNGTLVDSNIPVIVSGIGSVTHLAAGTQHTCARKSDGTVACWGTNSSDLLADTALGDYSMAPVAIKGLEDIVDITSANARVCALNRDGTVRCWGSAWDDDIGFTTPPIAVAGLIEIADIVAGSGHACALRSGTVYCWGLNRYGQLGNGTTMASNVPVMLPSVSGVIGMTAGGGHTCARKTDASVLCWGSNDSGELGNGTSLDSTVPTAVVGL
jgi:alpha-tubulin suppressor-like RCC1 family protein